MRKRPVIFKAIAGLIALAFWAPMTHAKTNTWRGSAASSTWSSGANWTNNVPPANGDAVLFAAGSITNQPINNDIVGLTLDQIIVTNSMLPRLRLGGNTLTLNPASRMAQAVTLWRSGTSATGIVTFAHGFTPNRTVVISGAPYPFYGVFNVQGIPSPTSFTFTVQANTGPLSATGAVQESTTILNLNPTTSRDTVISNALVANAAQAWRAQNQNAITVIGGELTGAAEIAVLGNQSSSGVNYPTVRFAQAPTNFTGTWRMGTNNAGVMLLNGGHLGGTLRLEGDMNVWIAGNASNNAYVGGVPTNVYTFGIGTGAGEIKFAGSGNGGLTVADGLARWDPGRGGDYTWNSNSPALDISSRVGQFTNVIEMGNTVGKLILSESDHNLRGAFNAPIVRLMSGLSDDGTARHLDSSVRVLELTRQARDGNRSGSLRIRGGALSFSNPNQLLDGSLMATGGVIVFDNVSWASFASNRVGGYGGPLSKPVNNPTPQATSNGTLTSGTYHYRWQFIAGTNVSPRSDPISIELTGAPTSSAVSITLPSTGAYPTALKYRLYRSLTPWFTTGDLIYEGYNRFFTDVGAAPLANEVSLPAGSNYDGWRTWHIAGASGGLGARTTPLVVTPDDPAIFDRSFTLGSTNRGADGRYYADQPLLIEGTITLSGRQTWYVAPQGPGLDTNRTDSVIHEIRANLADARADAPGSLRIDRQDAQPAADYEIGELVLGGTNTLSASAYGGDPGNSAINSGPGGLGVTDDVLVRFAHNDALPRGHGGALSYLFATRFNVTGNRYGYLLTADAGNPVYDPATNQWFVIGGRLNGVFGVAGQDWATLRNGRIAIWYATGAGSALGLNLLARDAHLTLGDSEGATHMIRAATASSAADGGRNSAATPLINSSAARTLIKRGTGTIALGNVEYHEASGAEAPASVFAWQIGRSANNPADSSGFFDGAIRSWHPSVPGVGTSNSLASFNHDLRGGVIEFDSRGIALGAYTRGLGTATNAVRWSSGGGGFAAYNGPLTINLGGAGATQTWASTANFVPNGNPLIFGSLTANDAVTYQNGIALNGALREVRVMDNADTNSDYAVLSGVLSGTGSAGLLKAGPGTLVLTASNTYSSLTLVTNGALVVNGTLSSGGGTVRVHEGAWLGGTGRILRAVQVFEGGTLAPGFLTSGTGTLSVSSLALSNNATVRMEAGAQGDRVAVSSALVLTGTLHVAAAAGFTGGTNVLFTFGTRTGDGLTPGDMPLGYDFDKFVTNTTTYSVAFKPTVRPVVLTHPATNVLGTTAWAVGSLVSTGSASGTVRIYWGTTDGGVNPAAWSNVVNLGVQAPGTISNLLSGLSFGASYYYRIQGSNIQGVTWAPTGASFTTYQRPSIANPEGATAITTASGIFNGALLATGSAPASVTLYWGTSDGGSNASGWTFNRILGSQPIGAIATNITELAPDTRYYYRFTATNLYGMAWAPTSATFRTIGPPTVQNNDGAAGVTYSNAWLRGQLTGGVQADIRLYYGLSDGGTNATSWSNVVLLAAQPQGAFSQNVAVAYNAAYWYRAHASNAAGQVWAPLTASFSTPYNVLYWDSGNGGGNDWSNAVKWTQNTPPNSPGVQAQLDNSRVLDLPTPIRLDAAFEVGRFVYDSGETTMLTSTPGTASLTVRETFYKRAAGSLRIHTDFAASNLLIEGGGIQLGHTNLTAGVYTFGSITNSGSPSGGTNALEVFGGTLRVARDICMQADRLSIWPYGTLFNDLRDGVMAARIRLENGARAGFVVPELPDWQDILTSFRVTGLPDPGASPYRIQITRDNSPLTDQPKIRFRNITLANGAFFSAYRDRRDNNDSYPLLQTSLALEGDATAGLRSGATTTFDLYDVTATGAPPVTLTLGEEFTPILGTVLAGRLGSNATLNIINANLGLTNGAGYEVGSRILHTTVGDPGNSLFITAGATGQDGVTNVTINLGNSQLIAAYVDRMATFPIATNIVGATLYIATNDTGRIQGLRRGGTAGLPYEGWVWWRDVRLDTNAILVPNGGDPTNWVSLSLLGSAVIRHNSGLVDKYWLHSVTGLPDTVLTLGGTSMVNLAGHASPRIELGGQATPEGWLNLRPGWSANTIRNMDQGTLRIRASGSVGDFEVIPGASNYIAGAYTLTVTNRLWGNGALSGATGTVTITTNATLDLIDGAVGRVDVAGNLITTLGSISRFDVGSETNDFIKVGGTIQLRGTVYFSDLGGLYQGTSTTYRLIQHAGATLAASVYTNDLALPGTCSAYLTNAANYISLVLVEKRPAVRTRYVTNLTAGAATLVGQLTSTGGAPTQVFAYWGASDGGTNKAAWGAFTNFGVRPAGSGLISNTIPLSADNLYYFRFYATNALGDFWATETQAFTTHRASVYAADVEASEVGPTSARFLVIIPAVAALPADFTIAYTIGGTASNGVDYTRMNGLATIPAGHNYTFITVQPIADGTFREGDETVILTLKPADYLTTAPTNATIILRDAADGPWLNRMPIVFNYIRTEALLNIPMLVILGEHLPGFRYSDFAATDGSDLRFANSNLTQFLNYEIERWNPTGQSLIWVQVPRLRTNDTIYALWGAAESVAAPLSWTDGSVWTNRYLGVWHMNTAATSQVDRTTNAWPATTDGVAPESTSGTVGNALVFTSTNRLLTPPVGIAGAVTRSIYGWAKPSTLSQSDWAILFGLQGGGNNRKFVIANDASSPKDIDMDIWGTQYFIADIDTNWVFLAATYDGGTVRTYRDGQLITSGGASLSTDDNGFMIGNYLGALDEIRLSTATRSDNWLWAIYMNMASNAAFVTYGPAVEPLALRTLDAAAITATSATMRAEMLRDSGAAATVYLCWGATAGGYSTGAWSTVTVLGDWAEGTFPEAGLTGLVTNQRYYYAFYATNAQGEAWGHRVGQFTTLGAPLVLNGEASDADAGAGTATLNGELRSTGTASTVVWSLLGAEDWGEYLAGWNRTNALGPQVVGPLSTNLAGLVTNTTYYFRFLASNIIGQAWGAPSSQFRLGAPTIANLSATNILLDRAVLNGMLVTTGTAPSAVWVYWGQSDGQRSKTLWSNSRALGNYAAGAAISTLASNLLESTTYYYRFYASNANGGAWAPATTNFTSGGRPAVNNASGATNITDNSAVLNGRLVSAGSAAATLSVFWGPVDGETNAAAWTDAGGARLDFGPAGAGPYSTNVTGVTPGAYYYYRFYAENALGSRWAGSTETFRILGAPVITNGIATNLSAYTAELLGQLMSTGVADTAVSVYYGLADGGANAGDWPFHLDVGSRPVGVVTAAIPDLTPTTTYYFRFAASNSAGLAWAPVSSAFTTRAVPAVDNAAPASIGFTNATLRGTLVSTGSLPTTVFVYYGLTDGGTNKSLWPAFHNFGVRAPALLSTNVGSLQMNRTYYYRFYASNAGATAWAPASTNFLTLGAPIVTNRYVTNLLETSAQVHGRLVSTGGSTNATVRLYWGPTDGGAVFTSWSNMVSLGALDVSSFSNNLTSLTGGRYYYFRYYATNTVGEHWAVTTGVFRALGAPAINNTTPSGIAGRQANLNGTLSSTGNAPTTVSVFFGDADGGASLTGWSNRLDFAGFRTAGSVFSTNVTLPRSGGAWYYRYYATNAYGETWAEPVTNFRAASAFVPFLENFEAGLGGSYWATSLGAAQGRMFVTNAYGPIFGDRHLITDSSNTYSRNMLTLTIDLSDVGTNELWLSYWAKNFGGSDNNHALWNTGAGGRWYYDTGTETGSDQDMILIKAPASTSWWTVAKLFMSYGHGPDYRLFAIPLHQVIADEGLTNATSYQIRFQWYDRYLVDGVPPQQSGLALDQIRIDTTPPAGMGTRAPVTEDFEDGEFGEGWWIRGRHGGRTIQITNYLSSGNTRHLHTEEPLSSEATATYVTLLLDTVGTNNLHVAYDFKSDITVSEMMPWQLKTRPRRDGLMVSATAGRYWTKIVGQAVGEYTSPEGSSEYNYSSYVRPLDPYVRYMANGTFETNLLLCFHVEDSRDGYWNSKSKYLDNLLIVHGADITNAAIPDARQGVAYGGFQFSATGGSGSYSEWLAPYYWRVRHADNTFSTNDAPEGLKLWGENQVFTINLPFAFPWREYLVSNLTVDVNGRIGFFPGISFPDNAPTLAKLLQANGLAVYWSNLSTVRTSATDTVDLYLGTNANSATLRWEARHTNGTPVNAAVTFHRDGRILLRYGEGNELGGHVGMTDLWAPAMSIQSATGSLHLADDVWLEPIGMPPGLSVDALNGAITGTPLTAGTNTVMVHVLDSDGIYGSREYSLITAHSLEIVTDALPDATQLVAYAGATLNTTNAMPPVDWLVERPYVESLTDSTFTEAGVARNWQADDSSWDLPLPFGFPFYGQTYTNLTVDSNGRLIFPSGASSDRSPNLTDLLSNPQIAALWGDIRTDAAGDIFVATNSVSVTIRWLATYTGGGAPVNVSVSLFDDGRIMCAYGDGNTAGGWIAISAGDGMNYVISSQSQLNLLPDSPNVVFTPQSGGYVEYLEDNDWFGLENYTTQTVSGVTLPFNFPFYGRTYRQIYVSPDGYLTFNYTATSIQNASLAHFTNVTTTMIAPLWADQRASDNDSCLLVEPNGDDEVIVWWHTRRQTSNDRGNYAVALNRNGAIRFMYGTGNSFGGFIGISGGGTNHVIFSQASGSMSGANTITYTPVDTFTYAQSLMASAWPQIVSATAYASAAANLPFDFPFADNVYAQATVDTYGRLFFGTNGSMSHLSPSNLHATTRMLAVMSSPISNGLSQAIYLTTNATFASFRWEGHIAPSGYPLRVVGRLYRDGSVRYLYGRAYNGLANGFGGVVGVSDGRGGVLTSAISQSGNLDGAETVFTRIEGLPTGLTMSPGGVLSGMPHDSFGAIALTFRATDSAGSRGESTLPLRVYPNVNRPPFVISNTPPDAVVYINEGSTNQFLAFGADPEAATLSYRWKRDGLQVQFATNRQFTLSVAMPTNQAGSTAGLYNYRAHVEDGLYSHTNSQIYAEWTVVVKADNDDDGMPNWWEMTYAFAPGNPADAYQDTDNDGLLNLEEYQAGTHPRQADTDGDTLADKWELMYGFDPLTPNLTPLPGASFGLTMNLPTDFALDAFQVGTNLFVADMDEGLISFAIGPEGTNAIRLDAYATGGVQTRRLVVTNGYAFLACDNAGMQVVDISDPANLTLAGGYASDGAQDVAVIGDRCYIADSMAGLLALDVSDPSTPAFLWSDASSYYYSVAANNTHVFAGDDGWFGLVAILDTDGNYLSDYTLDPVSYDAIYSLALVGDTLYVAANGLGLYILDVSDPGAIAELGVEFYGGAAQDVMLKPGSTALCLANGSDGFRYLNVANPAAVATDFRTNLADSAYGVFATPERVYAAAGADGVSAFEFQGGVDGDADGLPDWWEAIWLGGTAQHPTNLVGGISIWGKYLAYLDPTVTDTDGDTISDYDEVWRYRTNPNNADTDGDGMPDAWEIRFGTNPLYDDAQEDPDGENLVNWDEWNRETDPFAADTDGDGMDDTSEVNVGRDPLSARDGAMVYYSFDTPADLIISEYIEGASNNKALEIYNPTANSVDLSLLQYRIQVYSNGNTNPSSTTALSGVQNAGSTYILAHVSADPVILALSQTNSGNIGFNGNDAVRLIRGDTDEVVDSIGRIGEDPGAAWSSNGVSTLNMTLVRKAFILRGDRTADDIFDPSLQWDPFSQDTFTNLGTHAVSYAFTNGVEVFDALMKTCTPFTTLSGVITSYVGDAFAGLGTTNWGKSNYFAFTVSLPAFYAMDVTRVGFDATTNSAPRVWQLRYSWNNYATVLSAGTNGVTNATQRLTPSSNLYVRNLMNLSLTGLTNNVTFRLYGTNATSALSPWSLDNVFLLGDTYLVNEPPLIALTWPKPDPVFMPEWQNRIVLTAAASDVNPGLESAYWECIDWPPSTIGVGDQYKATIEAPFDTNTYAVMPAQGMYVFRYVATDGIDSTQKVITVYAGDYSPTNNNAPWPKSGNDLIVVYAGGTVTQALAGVVSDVDGPVSNALWTQVSPTAPTVSFVNATITNTSVIITNAGVYTLRLTADDGLVRVFDEVKLTVTNAPPGLTVSTNAVAVDENGATAQFTVKLNTLPSADVTIGVLSSNHQLSLSPTQLIFTASDWAAPQTVTVVAIDDAVAESTPHGDTVIGVLTSGDPAYDGMPMTNVAVSIADNETPGILFSESSLAVTEGGATDSYTVRLLTEPMAVVTIQVAAVNGQIGHSPQALTFDAGNWSTPQAVSVWAIDDAIVEGAHVSAITQTLLSADTVYATNRPPNIPVSIADNDIAGVWLTPTALTVSEGGPTNSYTLRLASQPATGAVTVHVAGVTVDLTVAPTTAVFTAANWSAPQAILVAAVNDAFDEDTETNLLTHVVRAGDPIYHNLAGVSNLTVAIMDNDTAAIILSTNALAVAEGGATNQYTVMLATEPSATVTVRLSHASDQLTLLPTTAVFTAVTYSQAVTVQVWAVDDVLAEGTLTSLVAHTALGGDTRYTTLGATNLAVEMADNDIAGLALSTNALSVTEGGISNAYTLRLTAPPSAVVTVAVSRVGGDADCAPTGLVFDAGNWATPQTVTIWAVDDALVEPVETNELVHMLHSADPAFDAVAGGSVHVTVTDNDLTGVRISTNWLSVAEGGTSTEYVVYLDSQPYAFVTVLVANADAAQLDAAPVELIFDPLLWNIAKTVTVAAVDDALSEPTVTNTLAHSVWSEDAAYQDWPAQPVYVEILDDDDVLIVTVYATQPWASELGTNGVFTIVLNKPAVTNMAIPVSVGGSAMPTNDYNVIAAAIAVALGETNVTAQIVPVADTVAETNETVELSVPPHPEYTVGTPSNAVVTILPLPLDTWKIAQFGGIAAANAPDGADDADPDNDGLPNLGEYALYRNPTNREVATGIRPGIESNRFFMVRYTKRTDLPDVTIEPQYSTNLNVNVWTNTPILLTNILETSNVDTQTIKARLLSPMPAPTNILHFMRLKFSRP